VSSSCKHAYDTFYSMKDGKFLEKLRDCYLLKRMLLLAPCALNYLKAMAVDGSVRISTPIYTRTQIMMYAHVGKNKKKLFFILWLRAVRERFYWLKFEVWACRTCGSGPDHPPATLIGGVETSLCTDLLHSMFNQGN
jgi:hypothetical protein